MPQTTDTPDTASPVSYLLVFIILILIYMLIASTMLPSVPHSLELNL